MATGANGDHESAASSLPLQQLVPRPPRAFATSALCLLRHGTRLARFFGRADDEQQRGPARPWKAIPRLCLRCTVFTG